MSANQKRKRVTSVLDTQVKNLDTDLTFGQMQDLKLIVDNTSEPKEEKEKTNMTPSTNSPKVKRIQRSVFDLTAFDTIKLVKDVTMPDKPTSIPEALEMVGGSQEKLLQVIYDGLAADVAEKAWDEMTGYKLAGTLETDEKGITTFTPDTKILVDQKITLPEEDYSGKYADDAKADLINDAVLSLAKMQGYDKNKSADEKKALKEKAREFLRSNPAMLASIQG